MKISTGRLFLQTEINPLLGSRRLRTAKQYLGKKFIPKLPVTRHVFNHLRWELNALWVTFHNTFNPFARAKIKSVTKKHDLSVNIGCGPFGREGWVNIDLMKIPKLSFRYDCRKRLPFRENTVSKIRCEHFFEHLDHLEEAPFFLRNCLKCLTKGGVLRIIVPDAGAHLVAYVSGEIENWKALDWDLDHLPPDFYTPMDIVNHIFRQQEEHRYAYDFETLRQMLYRAGFTNIVKTEFGISLDPKLCDDLPIHKSYSLYVDAVK